MYTENPEPSSRARSRRRRRAIHPAPQLRGGVSEGFGRDADRGAFRRNSGQEPPVGQCRGNASDRWQSCPDSRAPAQVAAPRRVRRWCVSFSRRPDGAACEARSRAWLE